MKRILFWWLLTWASSGLWAQATLYPSDTKGRLDLYVKDFDGGILPKVEVKLEGNGFVWEGKTDKRGIVQVLIPRGLQIGISIEDSAHYDQVSMPDKPSQVVRHTVQYHGAIDGKMLPPPRNPMFGLPTARNGFARVEITLVDRKMKPIEGEALKLVSSDSLFRFAGTSDPLGKLHFEVPMGHRYILQTKFNRHLDEIDLPTGVGAPSQVKLTLGILSAKQIEENLVRIRESGDTLVKGIGAFDKQAVKKFQALAEETGGILTLKGDGETLLHAVEAVVRTHVKPGTDVVFLVDETGSMWNDVERVRAGLDTLTRAMSQIPNIRFGVAGYGDINVDGEDWYRMQDFSGDLSKVRECFQMLTSVGGGDYPESVYDGLFQALNSFSWESKSKRMVILIGDAAPLEGAQSKHSVEEVVQFCKGMGIKANLYPILLGW